MNTALAIFVKTPTLSPIKTRLSATIGVDAALQFYRLSLKAVTAVIKKLNKKTNVDVYWAVAERAGLDNPLWQDFPKIYTKSGNLGERQHYVYQTLRQKYHRVLLIGADTPQLSSAIVSQAINLLSDNNFVIGPSRDGGYYLFGGRIETAPQIWTSIPWSTNVTRLTLAAALPTKAVYLQTLTDVDYAEDLNYIAGEMPNDINAQQRALLAWIHTLNVTNMH